MSLAIALSFLRSNWRTIIPLAGIAVLGIGLLLAKMDATHWRKKYDNQVKIEQLAEAKRAADKAEAEAGFARALADASSNYATRLADSQPLILRSKDTVREFAQTDAGRVACLAPDRVRGIEDYDRALGDTAAASPSLGPVPDPAAPAPR